MKKNYPTKEGLKRAREAFKRLYQKQPSAELVEIINKGTMKSNKDINEMIANMINEPKLFDLRCEFRIVSPNLTLEEAQAQYQAVEPENKHLYSITTSQDSPKYSEDLNETMRAAKLIANKNNGTFLLTIEDGQYKAAFGSYADHADYVGGNPAYAACVAILKYMGKL